MFVFETGTLLSKDISSKLKDFALQFGHFVITSQM